MSEWDPGLCQHCPLHLDGHSAVGAVKCTFCTAWTPGCSTLYRHISQEHEPLIVIVTDTLYFQQTINGFMLSRDLSGLQKAGFNTGAP